MTRHCECAPPAMTIAYLAARGSTVVLFGLTWPVIKIGLSASTPVWLAAARASLSALSRLRPAGGARAPALAAPRRLADRAVGRRLPAQPASSPSPISACRACRPAARACWPTPTMLWMVPLSLLVGETGRLARRRRRPARPAGHRRADRSLALRLERPRIVEGHAWLLLAGFSWALAVLHARRHRWRLTPLDVLPWQMSVATILLWLLALRPRARRASRFQPGRALDGAGLSSA